MAQAKQNYLRDFIRAVSITNVTYSSMKITRESKLPELWANILSAETSLICLHKDLKLDTSWDITIYAAGKNEATIRILQVTREYNSDRATRAFSSELQVNSMKNPYQNNIYFRKNNFI